MPDCAGMLPQHTHTHTHTHTLIILVSRGVTNKRRTHTYACTHSQGTLGERFSAALLGGNPRLKAEEVVYTPGDRFRLNTVSGGIVHLELGEGGKEKACVCV